MDAFRPKSCTCQEILWSSLTWHVSNPGTCQLVWWLTLAFLHRFWQSCMQVGMAASPGLACPQCQHSHLPMEAVTYKVFPTRPISKSGYCICQCVLHPSLRWFSISLIICQEVLQPAQPGSGLVAALIGGCSLAQSGPPPRPHVNWQMLWSNVAQSVPCIGSSCTGVCYGLV